MHIAITGSSGLIGRALQGSLLAAGHTVLELVRDEPGPWSVVWDPAGGRLDPAHLEGVDAVVHLAGAPIGERKWTDDQKRLIMESRVESTRLLATTMAQMANPPGVLLSASGVNYYGDRGDEILTEESDRGSQFLSKVCRAWEHEARAAEAGGVRVALLRSAPVLDRMGGVLPRIMRPFSFGLGGRLGSGKQWFSWITLEDEVRAIRFLLESEVSGPVNLCAPHPVTNQEFTKALAKAMKRPAFMAVPAGALRFVFGKERAEELLLGSVRAIPEVLTRAGFEFRQPDLATGLRRVLGG